jgi:hypothetical protein
MVWVIRGDMPYRIAHTRPLSQGSRHPGAMDVRRELNRIAVAQHSLVTFDQALRAGLSTGQLRHKVRSGEWAVVRPRVYAVSGAPATWAQAVAATAYSLSPGVWVSHLTAGRLWGLDVSPPDDIDVLVELDRRVKKAGVRSHRTGALFTADLSSCQRIPVTSPERTVVDLSASVAATALARVVDDGLRRRLVRLDRLSSCVARLPKSPGRRPRSSTSCSLIACPDTTPVTAISRRGSCAPSWPRVWPYRSSSTGSGSASGPSASTWPTRCSSWPSSSMVGSSIAPAPPSTTTGPGPTPSSPAGWTVLRFTSRSTDAEIVACVRAAMAQCGRIGAA